MSMKLKAAFICILQVSLVISQPTVSGGAGLTLGGAGGGIGGGGGAGTGVGAGAGAGVGGAGAGGAGAGGAGAGGAGAGGAGAGGAGAGGSGKTDGSIGGSGGIIQDGLNTARGIAEADINMKAGVIREGLKGAAAVANEVTKFGSTAAGSAGGFFGRTYNAGSALLREPVLKWTFDSNPINSVVGGIKTGIKANIDVADATTGEVNEQLHSQFQQNAKNIDSALKAIGIKEPIFAKLEDDTYAVVDGARSGGFQFVRDLTDLIPGSSASGTEGGTGGAGTTGSTGANGSTGASGGFGVSGKASGGVTI